MLVSLQYLIIDKEKQLHPLFVRTEIVNKKTSMTSLIRQKFKFV